MNGTLMLSLCTSVFECITERKWKEYFEGVV